MKKAIALISILAALTVPVLANTSTTGLGINLGQSYMYALKKNVKSSMATNFDITFNTAGGTTFYVHNEFGSFNGNNGNTNTPGSETIHGIGVLANVGDSGVRFNLMLGSATTEYTGVLNAFGSTNLSEAQTNSIADVGAGYHSEFGNAKVAVDIAYRHHMLNTGINLSATEKFYNKSGIRLAATVGYGF